MKSEPPSGDSKPNPKHRKPWPMWPIVLAIIGFMVFYTWVQFSFRKLEKPYMPNEAMQESDSKPAQKNLYGWYSLKVDRIEDPEYVLAAAAIDVAQRSEPLENELPAQVVYYLPRKPILAPDLQVLSADARIGDDRRIRVSLGIPQALAEHPLFRLTALYKEETLILLPELRIEDESGLADLDSSGETMVAGFSIRAEPVWNGEVQVKLYSRSLRHQWLISSETSIPIEQ